MVGSGGGSSGGRSAAVVAVVRKVRYKAFEFLKMVGEALVGGQHRWWREKFVTNIF
jgi:hypothetical protein